MTEKVKYAMQIGGMLLRWANPDRTYVQHFLKLDFECEADPYPGILILTDSAHHSPLLCNVINLRKELPYLLKRNPERTVGFWWLETDDKKRQAIVKQLTESPVYDDVL